MSMSLQGLQGCAGQFGYDLLPQEGCFIASPTNGFGWVYAYPGLKSVEEHFRMILGDLP